jgi:hypothetical protein
MVFKINETVGGVKHLGLNWARLLGRRSRDRFLPQYKDLGQAARRPDGRPIYCHTCGYTRVQITLSNGWTMETCSAMPILRLNSEQFAAWREAAPREKLPVSCV